MSISQTQKEPDGHGWKVIVNRRGRKAHVLIRQNGCAFGGVIEWQPAAMPYQAMVTLPRHEEKWFEELNPAKDFVTARLVAYEMSKYL
jgi:hypothetical protein